MRIVLFFSFLIGSFLFLSNNIVLAYTNAECDTLCKSGEITDAAGDTCKTESDCQGYGTTCHQNGCVGVAVLDGAGCNCSKTGCSSTCSGNWIASEDFTGHFDTDYATYSTEIAYCGCYNGEVCVQESCTPRCPSGKTHTGECGPDEIEKNAIEGTSCNGWPYTCVDCVPEPEPCECECGDNSNHCGNYTSDTMLSGGSTCLSEATCTEKLCVGTKSCDDGNGCTDDSCPVDTCINANNSNTTSCDQQFGECSVAGGTKTCSGGSYGSCSGATDPRPSTCASSASSFCYYQSFDDGCGGTTCTGSISASPGTNGSCGTSNGGTFATTPSSNLCTTGSSSVVTEADGTYSWTCSGTSGVCGGASGSNANCSATSNREPTFDSLVLKNSVNSVVAAEAGERNHICQSDFAGDRIVKFVVTGSDGDGDATISEIKLRLGATVYTETPVNGTATFTVNFPESDPTSTFNIEVLIDDGIGSAATWEDTGRDLKIWNCEVSVTGAIYDGSDVDTVVCSTNTGFTNLMSGGIDYSLVYEYGASSPRTMSVTSPTYNNGESDYLIWSDDTDDSYTAIFSLAGTIDDNIRVIDLGVGTTTCIANSVGLNLSSVVSAYSDSPSLQVDFSSVLDQDPWFQTEGGGIYSKTRITNLVPITCAINESCVEAMSADNTSIGTYNNGLVTAPYISNNSGCGDSCKEGLPNDWKKESNVTTDNSTYTYYLKEYNQKLSQGTTFVGDVSMADVMIGTNGTGVAFVSGDLNVGTNNAVADRKLLMIIVGQDINVDPAVDRMDGVFVANNINVGGTSANQLVINGSLYAVNGVTLDRGYTEESDNNTSPATIVKYRPDFVFNMPGRLVKILSGWKVGF